MTENITAMGEVVSAPDTREALNISAQRANPLANFNLRLLWIGESISLLGDQFYMVALPWLVLQLTGSGIAVGAILAVAGIPRALLMLVGGVLTDRLSPRVLMLLSNGSRVVITALLTLLVITNTIQVWMLFVFSLAFGVVDAFFHPAYMAMIPMIVEENNLGAGNAMLQGTSLLVSAVGPGIGGVLVKTFGTALSFFLDTLSFVVATLALLVMNPAQIVKPVAKARPAGMIAEIREAVAYMFGDDLLRPLGLIVMALNFLFVGPIMVGPALLAKERFAEGSVALGVLLSAMGVGSLIGMLAAAVLKPSRIGVTTLSSVALAGLCIVLSGFTQSLWLTAVLFAIGGASSGFSNLLLITWLQRYINKDMMGRMMSIVMLTSMGLMPVAAAVSGFIAEYNLTLVYVLNGSLLILTVVVSLLNKTVRTMRA
jgi:MFS family permease